MTNKPTPKSSEIQEHKTQQIQSISAPVYFSAYDTMLVLVHADLYAQ